MRPHYGPPSLEDRIAPPCSWRAQPPAGSLPFCTWDSIRPNPHRAAEVPQAIPPGSRSEGLSVPQDLAAHKHIDELGNLLLLGQPDAEALPRFSGTWMVLDFGLRYSSESRKWWGERET